MRYFGKDGPQCDFVCQEGLSRARRARLMARSLLFGRVPRRMVMWLGLGMMVFSLTLGILCLGSMQTTPDNIHRDLSPSLLIRR